MKSILAMVAMAAAAMFLIPATASADNCRKSSRSYHSSSHYNHNHGRSYRAPTYYGRSNYYRGSNCGPTYYRSYPSYRYSGYNPYYRSYRPTYYYSRPSVNFGYSGGSCRTGSSFYFGFSR